MSGCRRPLAPDQWWGWCGETDMGQTAPALCTECGGSYKLKDDINKLPNGDFEVGKKQSSVHFGPVTEDGRQQVHWWIDGRWEAKGWLMPPVK